EQESITEYFGYSRGEAPILGFCRWDALTDRSDPADRIILVMPTWRLWLEENTSEEFVRSTYYRNYSGLLTDPRLLAALKENHTRLIFYIHPKLRDHLQDFKADESIIELIPFGEQPLNEIIMKCSMLITDYSSVCWDAYYLEKPVLFYHFDREDYITAHGGSYLDFSTELFGDSFETGDALVDGIIACMEDGFREKEAYAAMRPRYFAYRDDNNCKRTYDFIVSKGF
ncbi:MAG: CDP-glycerol glycerophosphotransferase family protein, partial [Blautia sp.]|nr:CDP-glycerol glycerophosphotransferase family protein [Blautia sp.]